jgi:type IV pilus assembly protein PilM
MPSSSVCWGIELGAGAVKALKLVRDGENVSVADFAVIPHKRPLSAPDVDEMDAMRVGIGALVSQYDLSKATIALSIPGHASFARFAKLPPVEPKKVPEIVKFEAAQQIPFSLDEVEWDYQTFVSEDSPDVEVGIFAVTRERVMEKLSLCADVKIRPDVIALSPVSVFNASAYDMSLTPDSPGTVIIDIGTTATDLIVIEAGRVWIRTFPLGGHNFTEAIASSFKLPYPKAEKLKREAESSKHKRHIFQAMRPAFSDFGQDVQRSLQYYKQLHPDANLKQVIGIGSTFQLPGLRKILSQQLQLEVKRCEGFARATMDGARSADLQSSAISLMTCYGLALQGLGLATIDANLIPTAIVRESMWQRKTPWFAAAAVLSIAAGAASFVRPIMDQQAVDQARNDPSMNAVNQATSLGQRLKSEWDEISGAIQPSAAAENVRSLMRRRDVYSSLVDDVGAMLASADPQEAAIKADAAALPPSEWRFYDLVGLNVEYQSPGGALVSGGSDAAVAAPEQTQSDDGLGDRGGGRARPGSGGGDGASSSRSRARENTNMNQAAATPYGKMIVTLVVDSTNSGLTAFVDETILAWLRENAEREGVPYTLTAPSPDAIIISEQGGSADGRDSQQSGGGRDDGAADTSALATLAPLPSRERSFPEGAKVYRYTITFDAPLKDPSGAAQAANTDAMGGFE